MSNYKIIEIGKDQCYHLVRNNDAIKNPVSYGYGEEAKAALLALKQKIDTFEAMPLVGEVKLFKSIEVVKVRRVVDKFYYLWAEGEICSIRSSTVLKSKIIQAQWPRKTAAAMAIGNFGGSGNGVYYEGTGQRSTEYDYRIAPDGKVLILRHSFSFEDVCDCADDKAAEMLRQYFDV